MEPEKQDVLTMENKSSGLALEPLSIHETQPIDYEGILFQALVNEGKHIRVSQYSGFLFWLSCVESRYS
jgi:hypothetical protein